MAVDSDSLRPPDPADADAVRAGHRNLIRGCLLGGAVGDALGAPVEFDSLADIRQVYGPAGVVEMGWYADRRGAITDDTQMTLFTAEGLTRAGDAAEVPVSVYAAHRRWLITQMTDRPPATVPAAVQAIRGTPATEVIVDGGLALEEWLYARRAPGKACMRGLLLGGMGTAAAPANPHSKGCGAVMRSAPFGLVPCWDAGQAFRLAAECATQTHGHPSGFLAAGAFGAIIRSLAGGGSLTRAVEVALDLLAGRPGHEETSAALRAATDAARSGPPAPERLERLGGGWVAEEALAIAVYCALSHPNDLRGALLLAVNHSGDSDSTGAICGNLLGALLGPDVIPAPWLETLEGRTTIERVADGLTASRLLR